MPKLGLAAGQGQALESGISKRQCRSLTYRMLLLQQPLSASLCWMPMRHAPCCCP